MSARKHDDIFLRHEGRRTDKLYVTGSSVANNLVKNVDQTATISSSLWEEMSASYAGADFLVDEAKRSELGPIIYQVQQLQEDVDELYSELSASVFHAMYSPMATIDSVIVSGSITAGDTDSGSVGTIDAPFKDLYVQSSSIYLADMSDHNFGSGKIKWSQMSKAEKLQRATSFHKEDVDKLKRGESLNDSGHISASGDLHIVGQTHLKGLTKIEGNTTLHGETRIEGDTDIHGAFKVNGTTFSNFEDLMSYIKSLKDQNVSSTEFSKLDGIGSSTIISQLNAKQDNLSFGISNTNVIKAGSGIVDNDFLRIDGTTLEGRSASELKGDLSLVKGDVGLGNVDNTSDANKPVSTATTTALNLKLNLAGGTMKGLVQEPFVLTDSATIATAKGVIDARATRVFQILNQKGQTWNVVEATPTYRGQELTIIAMGAGTITHTNPGKLSSGIFVSPNGSNISVAANTVVKFVANFRLCWYQVV